jgi:hypothetical protein
MTGATRLEDLSRGPPNNYGMDDTDLLNNIVNEVQTKNVEYDSRNTDEDLGDGYYSEDEQIQVQGRYASGSFNYGNPNLSEPNPSQRREQYNKNNVVNPSRKPRSIPANVYTDFASRITNDTTQLATEVAMGAVLIYLSQMDNLVTLVNNFLPAVLKILDPMTGSVSFHGKFIKPLVFSFIFLIIRKYLGF